MTVPTLSVVMPNYNHAQFIGDALEAILKQSYRPMEIIIIDDASTDNSVDIIKQFIEREPIIRLIRNEENKGIIYNVNKLLQLSKGDYFFSTAADDIILPGFFEKSINLLSRHPQAGLCSTLSLLIDEGGNNKGLFGYAGIVSSKESFLPPEKVRKTVLKYGSWIQGNTTIFRRDALVDMGGFKPELHSFTDGFLHIVLSHKFGACFVPEPLACWRKMESGHAVSTSRNPDIQLSVIEHAAELMESDYGELIPGEFTNWWKKKELFMLANNNWLYMYKGRYNDLIRFTKPLNVFHEIILFGLRIMMRIEDLSVTFYLMVAHSFFPGKMIRKKIDTFCRRIVLRL